MINNNKTTIDDDEFDKQYNYFADIADNHNFTSIWSLYEVNNINEQVYNDDQPLEMFYDKHWGHSVRMRVPKNPTWLILWDCADKLIKKSTDNHHIFIEDFKRTGNIIELYTGS